ncbi:succinate dehydrogenase assembly factor 2 [Lobulomyces angularis]|nr:succinate dehydrogenase assembly factor 2 [Lobulomyces angularis]
MHFKLFNLNNIRLKTVSKKNPILKDSFNLRLYTTKNPINIQQQQINADDPAAIPQYDDAQEYLSKYVIPTPVRPANEPIEQKRARLTWMSRKRGILETDLLLSTFSKKYLKELSSNDLNDYDQFLNENDWDIYYWATESRPIPEQWKNCNVVKKLIEHSKNKNKTILRMPEL